MEVKQQTNQSINQSLSSNQSNPLSKPCFLIDFAIQMRVKISNKTKANLAQKSIYLLARLSDSCEEDDHSRYSLCPLASVCTCCKHTSLEKQSLEEDGFLVAELAEANLTKGLVLLQQLVSKPL
ncbi:MAG: hypothetical protein AB2693_26605 [Candidatus Thiodiazotropha sp.]